MKLLPKLSLKRSTAQKGAALDRALQERKKLVRAQYAAPSPLDVTYQQRGFALDRKINQMRQKKG